MSSSEECCNFQTQGLHWCSPPISSIPNALHSDCPTSCNPSVDSESWGTGNSTACNHVPTQSFPPRALSALLELLALMLGTRPRYLVGSWWWESPLETWVAFQSQLSSPSLLQYQKSLYINPHCLPSLQAWKSRGSRGFCLGTWVLSVSQMYQHLKLPSIRFARLNGRMCSCFVRLLLCT